MFSDPLIWIILGGILMSTLALIGSVTLLLDERTLTKILRPLVAFAAGTLIGGAFFHMIPAGVEQDANVVAVFGWVALGFCTFLGIEQFLHWHHCERSNAACRRPLTYLILIGDGVHNFIGGLAIGGIFLVDIRLGLTAWLAAAAHEVPQELGDFAVLLHGGWSKRGALLFNVLSALTFLLGGLCAYVASFRIDPTFLIPFAGGNFLYIGASDLVPEINKERTLGNNAVHFVFFCAGLVMLAGLRVLL
jgi:zinc and cadmium transporter